MPRHVFAFVSVSVLLATGACVNTPVTPELSLSLARPSDTQKFFVVLQPLVEPVPINQIHSWRIRLTTASGEPVAKAAIFIGGGMPDHGHGFPTRPQVTELADTGTYLLEGMKFSMHGRWEIKLAIQAGDVSDMVTFNTLVALPATGR